jgi:hypothetical protein
MKLVLLILALLAPATFAQSNIDRKLATLTNKDAFTVKYDKFKDQTAIHFEDGRISNDKGYDPASLKLRGLFVFPGESLSADHVEGVGLSFKSNTRDWTFLRSNRLIIIADGKRFDLGDAHRTSNVNSGSRYTSVSVTETLLYVIPWSDFQKIANASAVEMQIGIFEGKFDDKTLGLIKSLAILGAK